MIKLICVNVPDGYEVLLTKGKIYEGKENDMYYDVSNDRSGNKDTYLKSANEIEYIPVWTIFVRLDNRRARQLKQIEV